MKHLLLFCLYVTCALDIVTGFLKTVQTTVSAHPGVVRLPLYL